MNEAYDYWQDQPDSRTGVSRALSGVGPDPGPPGRGGHRRHDPPPQAAPHTLSIHRRYFRPAGRSRLSAPSLRSNHHLPARSVPLAALGSDCPRCPWCHKREARIHRQVRSALLGPLPRVPLAHSAHTPAVRPGARPGHDCLTYLLHGDRSFGVCLNSFFRGCVQDAISVARQYTGPGDRSSPGFNRARRWPSRVRRRNPGPLSPGRRAAGMITVRASSAAADPNRSGHRLWSTAMRDGHGDARRAVSLGPLTCIPQDGLLRVRPEPRGTHFSG